MSTGKMPNPPDHLTSQTTPADVQSQQSAATVGMGEGSQPAPTAAPAGQVDAAVGAGASIASGAAPEAHATEVAPAPAESSAEAAPPFDLSSDLAGLIESQAEVIAQRLVYHSQMMFGVSAIGVDQVNAINAATAAARGIARRSNAATELPLVNVAMSRQAQVNDQSLPFLANVQVAGILEGLLLDVAKNAYAGNAERQNAARELLVDYFDSANERMQYEPKPMTQFLAPGPHPNARR